MEKNLDPLPWLDTEDGPGNDIWPDGWTSFSPRPGYSQDRQDYI